MDVAPMEPIAGLLKDCSGGMYVGVDRDPSADRRKVQVTADISALPFADGAIKWIICYHVLEHVVDDLKAMDELARVLSPDGLALIQVPWRPGLETDEDPTASTAERVRRFGQADHVRYYGDDFEARLRDAGLTTLRLSPADVLESALIDRAGLVADEPVWLATCGGWTTSRSRGDSILMIMRRMQTVLVSAWSRAAKEVASVQSLLEESRAESISETLRARVAVEDAERRADEWQRAYRSLRSRWPVNMMAQGVVLWRRTIGRWMKSMRSGRRVT
jgi:hypothetical protein